MKIYDVTQTVEVEVDESKFTPEFIAAFKDAFHDIDTVEEHRKYLAELYATGRIRGLSREFVEGYGELRNMGIKFRHVHTGVTTVDE